MKIFVKNVIRTHNLFSKRQRCYHRASKTQVTEKMIQLIQMFQWILLQLENLIVSV